jgi:GT2 family glycosyltransferase
MIGIVAIGRNEGERLRQCLHAAREHAPGVPVVYVDSGSTDQSLDIANEHGALVYLLDPALPFSAARARNEGIRSLLQQLPQTKYVQFIDGDCALQPGWIDTARRFLDENPKVAAVCGRRRERFPDASIYNRLADMEWNTPVGVAKSCGGDAMMRVSAFQQVGGYNNDVIAGEEPELCVRLRAAGFEIHRLDHEMTLHDAAMTRFGQWWKRNVRAGHAYAEGFDRHGAPPERFRAKEVRSNWIWGLGIPFLSVVGTALLGWLAPTWLWTPAVSAVALYTLLGFRVYRHRRRRGDLPRHARLYALFTLLGKFPQMLGQWKYRRGQRSGTRSRIIEYKQG